MIELARVFISYSSADKAEASELHSWIIRQGHEAFFDQHVDEGLVGGENWHRTLHKRLRWADVLVCLLTADYRKSAWCLAELAVAQSHGKDVVPVILRPVDAHPLIHSGIQLIDYRDRRVAHARLAKSFARVGGAGWPDERSPFLGLRAFDRDDRPVFFGRDEETRQLVELLRAMDTQSRPRMLVVEGPSGCGKSSLVRAGLSADLAKVDGWLLPARPVEPAGPDPLRCLARSLSTVDVGKRLLVSDLVTRLAAEPSALLSIADDFLAATGKKRLLLVFDQFEELYVQADETARAQLGALLTAAVEGPVRFVATLRPEYHATVLDGAALADLPVDTFALRPLSLAGLRTVIEEPAAAGRRYLDRELVDALITDTVTGDALPMLAFTLWRLAEGSRRGDTLTMARYREIGGVTGALVRQADGALEEAHRTSGKRRERIVADLVDWFVYVDDEDRPTRRRVNHNDLPQHVVTELSPFVGERLLTSHTDSTGATTLTVSHEAFLTAWPPLAEEVTRKSTALRARQEADRAANAWQKDRGPLWDRDQVAATLVALGTRWPRFRTRLTPRLPLTAATTEFLHASVRRARRRRGRAIAVPAVLAIGALVAAVLAVRSAATADQQHALALSRQLIAQSQLRASTEPVIARQLAAAAWHAARSDEARDNMVTLLAQQRGVLVGHLGGVRGLAFSPDGTTIATSSDDGTVRLWNPVDGHQIGEPLRGHEGPVRAVAFSPDGRFLASAGGDGAVRLWDPRTGRLLGEPLRGHQGLVSGVSFSQDSEVLASVSHDGTIRLWNPKTGRPIGEPKHAFAGLLNAVAFSPVADMVAVACEDGTVRLFDTEWFAEHDPPVGLYFAHDEPALAVAFDATGTMLASVGEDDKIRLWNRSSHDVRDLDGETGLPMSVAFAPNSPMLATAGLDQVARVWDSATGLAAGDPFTGHTGPVLSAAFSPDGAILATASVDGTVRLWDPATSRPRDDPLDLTSVTDLALNPDATVLAAGVEDGVELWDPVATREIGAPLVTDLSNDWRLAFSPNGTVLAGSGDDGDIRLWDEGNRTPRTFSGHDGPVPALAFNANGTVLASVGPDHVVRRRDPRSGRAIGSAGIGRTERPSALAFAGDGTLLTATIEDDRVRVWDGATGRAVATVPTKDTTTVALSPHGEWLATGSGDGTVRLWDPRTGHPRGGRLGTPSSRRATTRTASSSARTGSSWPSRPAAQWCGCGT